MNRLKNIRVTRLIRGYHIPLNKVSIDRLYRKTGGPNEKKDRQVKQLADDIFADLLSAPSGQTPNNGHNKKKAYDGSSPSNMRPPASNCCGEVATCWVSAWISRKDRCKGLLR